MQRGGRSCGASAEGAGGGVTVANWDGRGGLDPRALVLPSPILLVRLRSDAMMVNACYALVMLYRYMLCPCA